MNIERNRRRFKENVTNELIYMTKRARKRVKTMNMFILKLIQESARQKKAAMFLERSEVVDDIDEATGMILEHISHIRQWVENQVSSPCNSNEMVKIICLDAKLNYIIYEGG